MTAAVPSAPHRSRPSQICFLGIHGGREGEVSSGDEEDEVVSLFVCPIPNGGLLHERATGPAPTASIEHGHNPGFAPEDTVNRSFEVRVGDELFSSGGDKGFEPVLEEGVDPGDKVFVPLQKRKSHVVLEQTIIHMCSMDSMSILFSFPREYFL